MNPTTVVEMDEDSYMEMETTQIKGVDSTVRTTNAKLGPRATLIIREKVMTHGRQLAKSDFTVDLDGEDCHTNVISRSVAKDQSRQVFLARINGNARCYGHSECDAIIMDQGVVAAIPEVTANCVDASLVHEAAIGKIAGGAAHQADDPGPDGERGGGADRQRFSEINGPRERGRRRPLFLSAGMWYNTGKILCKGGRAVRTIYVDLVELDQSGALGLISSKVRILPAGGSDPHGAGRDSGGGAPVSGDGRAGWGILFSFEDEELPELPFFAVPGLELSARDRDGNWYGRSEALGEGVYCVTPEGLPSECQRTWAGFPAACWRGEEVREMWEPAPGLRVYPSKAEAAGQIRLIPLSELAPEALERGE